MGPGKITVTGGGSFQSHREPPQDLNGGKFCVRAPHRQTLIHQKLIEKRIEMVFIENSMVDAYMADFIRVL